MQKNGADEKPNVRRANVGRRLVQTLISGGVPNMSAEAQRSLARELNPVIGEQASHNPVS